ncbi:energy transducer TonB [Herbaspirillum sp. C7C8]|uniref:energy transducer TonB n=1 Tax=Herbaspirillum sp. C7C8 TaxID=2736665 RepID=UPI001F529A27|nr:energy transducer TonB [Herbaspirillum sp. C7C8]MCI1005071.1 energy transducer TonB [Herbaspirillum sp. C7C8]
MLSSLPHFPQRTAAGMAVAAAASPAWRAWPAADRWRTVRPALLVIAAHLGVLWLALQMRPLSPPAITPPVPSTVMLALFEPAPQPVRPSALPAPAPPVRTVHVRPAPTPRAHQAAMPVSVPVSAAPTLAPPVAAVTAPAASASSSSAPAAASAAAAPVAAVSRPSSPPVITSGVQYLTAPQPVYPAAARRRGDEGEVLLRVLINAQGSVEQIALEKSSGIASLDQAARVAVAQARFQPYVEQGRAQSAYVVVPIKFQLTQ